MPDMYGSGDMTNQQKAAILFIALGPEYSAKLFQHMDDDEIEQLTLEIANQKQVSSSLKAEIIAEFYSMCMAQDYISSGGLQYAQNVLEKALGPDKALEIINRLTTSLQVRPFDFLRKTDPAQLLNFIQNEHPQTIALVMAYLIRIRRRSSWDRSLPNRRSRSQSVLRRWIVRRRISSAR